MAKERIQNGPSEGAVLAPLACVSRRLAGRFVQEGGLGRAHQVFGADLNKMMDELNAVLAA